MSTDTQWIYDQLESKKIGQAEADFLLQKMSKKTKNQGAIPRSEQFDGAARDNVSAKINEDFSNKLKKIFADTLGYDESIIDKYAMFDTYALDSVAALEIVQKIEQEVGSLPKTVLFEYPTLDKLETYILSMRADQRAKPEVINKPVAEIKVGDLEEGLKLKFCRLFDLLPSNVDVNKTFDHYGVDSVGGLQFVNELDKEWGKLPKTILFEYPSIAELSEYLRITKSNESTKTKIKNADLNGSQTPSTSAGQRYPSATAECSSLTQTNDRFEFSGDPDAALVAVSDITEAANVDIAIVGLSGRYPGAENIADFETLLAEGRSSITEIPPLRWNWKDYQTGDAGGIGNITSRWGGFVDDCDKFDASFFNISPVEALAMDPQERLFLEASWSVLEDAGYAKSYSEENVSNVGVFVGVMNSDYEWLAAESYYRGKPIMAQSAHWSIANRVSHFFGLHGPSMSVNTACSSSLASIHLACESIKSGECDSAIAGGVNLILHPMHYGKLSWMGMLSPDGKCKSFGSGANGFVDGEGVGAVLLKSLSQAVQDGDHIYGVIKGTAINSGGKTPGYTVPNPNAQADLILSSFKNADVDASTISYVEAHGTGTELGDPIEVRGLTKAFEAFTEKKQYCAIGSVKSNIGHLESAAGIASFTKVLLQLKRKQLFPSLHAEIKNPHIEFDKSPFYVQTGLSPWLASGESNIDAPLRAAVSSFGAGGTNVSIVLEEHNISRPTVEEPESDQLFLFSAKCNNSLVEYINAFIKYLSQNNGVSHSSSFLKISELTSDIQALIADLMGVSTADVELTESFLDLGFSVSDVALLISRVNERFSTQISHDSLTQLDTPNELSKYLLSACESDIREHYQDLDNSLISNPTEHDRLSDIAYTLSVHRKHMKYRLAVIANGRVDLIDKLRGVCDELQNAKNSHNSVWRSDADNESNAVDIVTKLLATSEGGSLVKSMYQGQKSDLASTYTIGAEIPWGDIYDGKKHRRVSLPTYRFQGESYWITNDVAAVAVECGSDDLPELHYDKLLTTPEWVEVDRLVASVPSKLSMILVLKDGDEQASLLAQGVEDTGSRCLRVYLSSDTDKLLDEAEIQQFCTSSEEKISCCVLLSSQQFDIDLYSDTDYFDYMNSYDLALKDFFKTLHKNRSLSQIEQLTFVLMKQRALSKMFDPVSSLAALAKSIGNEYHHLDARILHVLGKDAQASVELVQSDTKQYSSVGNELLLDGELLYKRELVSINQDDIPAKVNPYKQNGVYIIFGGLGGIGYALAKHLIARAGARLVIVGRNAVPTHQSERWAELQRRTTNVCYISADVLNRESVDQVIVKTQKNYGPINGVFYSVGQIKDAAIHLMSDDEYKVVKDCKALGFMTVAKAMANQPLDFLMTFSSAASFSGPAGQGNYSSGCLFQDLYVTALSKARDYPVQTINWGYWGEVGMAAEGNYDRTLKQQGILPISNIEGMALIDAVVGLKVSQAVALKLESHSSEKTSTNTDIEANKLNVSTLNGVTESQVSEKVLLAIKDATEIAVGEKQLEDTWEELGVNSILAVKILEKIENYLCVRVYQNELLESGSPAGLARKLVSELTETKSIAQHSMKSPEIKTSKFDPLVMDKESSGASPVPADGAVPNNPVTFLLSTPRSGSTLLRVMLEGHPEIFSPPELHLLPFESLKQRKDILGRENKLFIREGLIESIGKLKGVDVERASSMMLDLEEDDWSIAETYKELVKLANGKIVVDKSPSYGADIEILKNAEKCCKEPKYIFLVRHPLSVMESFVRNRFDKLLNVGDDDPWKYAEKLWVDYNTNIQQWLNGIPGARACFIRYEDLVAQPEKEVRKICQLLEIEFESSMLNPYDGNRMTSGLNKASLSIGDPNFLTRTNIDKGLANAWKGCEEKIETLGDDTILLANKLGYDLKKKSYDLHPAQENYLKVFGKKPTWCLTYRFDMHEDPFDYPQFRGACDALIRRHEALRLNFYKTGSIWKQVVSLPDEAEVVYRDISDHSVLLEKAIVDIERVFFENMTLNGPLIKFAAIRYGEGKTKIIIFSHHLLIDGVSLSSLAAELKKYRTVDNSAIDTNYLTLIESIKSRENLCDLSQIDIVAGCRRFIMGCDHSDSKNTFSSENSVSRTASYIDFDGVTAASLFNVFSVALYRALSCLNTEGDPVVSHRLHRRWVNNGYEDCVGWHAGDMPMSLSRNKSIEAQKKQFSEKFGLLQDMAIGYELGVLSGKFQAAHEYSPVRLNYQPIHVFESDDVVDVEQYDADDNERLYSMDIIVRSYTKRFDITLKYSENLHDRETIESLLTSIERQMQCVLKNNAEIEV